MSELLKVADALAVLAHEGQVRKNSGKPYVSHPRQVSQKFSELCGEYVVTRWDEKLFNRAMAAALLHDVIEDTSYNADKIFDYLHENLSGTNALNDAAHVTSMVEDLTDTSKHEYPMCNRKERKTIDGARMSLCGSIIHLIKICDIICNVTDYANEDPKYAIEVYIPEKMTYTKFLVNLPIEYKRYIDNFLSQKLKEAKDKL